MRILIAVIGCFIFLSASAQKIGHADKYIDFVHKQREKVFKEFLIYNTSISYVSKDNTAKKVQDNYNKLMSVLTEAQTKVDSMPAFKKDSTHYDSSYKTLAKTHFKEYGILLSNSYNKVASLQKEAEQSYENMESFFKAKESADKKMKSLNEFFYLATVNFANNNEAKDSTRKDKLSERVGIVINVNQYLKQVYLLFFKSYKQEEDIQNAIDRKDVGDLKKSVSDLSKSSQAGQNVVDTISAFKNDKSLTEACKAILVTYEKETDNKIDPITDYFSAAKDFETVRSAFNSKQGHSGKEVDTYKKSVKIFNKALDKYNKAMNGIYEKKKRLLKRWDSTVRKFMNKYMPSL